MDNVIKELKLQLGKKEVSLTMEQAKKLKEALDELFGKEVVKEVHHHDYWRWRPWWDGPITYGTSTGDVVSPPDTTVWCTNTSQASYDGNTGEMTLKVA